MQLVIALLLASPPLPAVADSSDYPDFEQLRDPYRDALQAARKGDRKRFEQLYPAFSAYPLAPYLDYERLLKERYVLPGHEARAFVEQNADSPIGVRFLGHYLKTAGGQKRWGDYLDATEQEPRNEALRCYYHRALLARGERDQAWAGAVDLWRSGRSVDDACDPLFLAWRRAGQLTDELVWERALLAFSARRFALLRYLSSLASPALKSDMEALQRSYREPHRSRQIAMLVSDERRSDVLLHGLERYSRYDPARSFSHWQSLEPETFSAQQVERLERAISLRGLLEQDEDLRDWIDTSLPRWGDDRRTESRLRWAIEDLNWPAILSLSEHLTPAAAAEPVWLYWRGRALETLGRAKEATALFEVAAKERDYYGFLSADRLGLPYRFNEERLTAAVNLAALPNNAMETTLRVRELQALGQARDAHSEWAHTLLRASTDTQRQLGALAEQQGWYRFAIDAANQSRSWDLLSLRFPLAYTEVFRTPASKEALPLGELMAIARRESAFFPDARSPVGARGLMQLMPATGLGLARSRGLSLSTSDLYDVQQNVALGSAYYRQLLERFDGNRAVALAAYNAGPNRVKNWVGRGLPMDAWIETIPYRETRDYVKAVLAYAVVFDHRLGMETKLLSATERSAAH